MSTRRTVLALAITALVGGTLAFYYLAHKPVTPGQALAGAQAGLSLGVALALVLAAGGLGRRLLGMWLGAGGGLLSTGTAAVLAAALGLGVLGLALLLLGAARLYYPAAAWLLLAALLLGLRRDVRAWAADLLTGVQTLKPSGRLERLAAGFTLFVLALGLLRALAPPVTWDALVYHLTLPELYARGHSVWVGPADFSLFSGMPQLTEMLYTAAYLLRVDPAAGGVAAQVLGWAFGALLALGLACQARDLGLPAWLAPAILFSSLSVALELAWAYADLLLMLCAWGTLVALSHWRRPTDPRAAARWLALAGLFAGLAGGCKYTGVIVPLAGGVVVLAGALGGPGGAARARVVGTLRSAVIFAAAAFAVFAPWLLKNWLLTGSPVYPLLWPAADMDALRQWFYNRPDLAEPLGRALLSFGRATFLGVQGGNAIDATLGPLLLLGAALLAFSWRGLVPALRRELLLILGFVAAAYLGWVALALTSALARQARLFFACLPALALLGVAGLAGLRRLNTPTLRLSLIVNAACGLVLGLSALEVGVRFVEHNPLPVVVGVQSPADYAAAELGWYAPALAQVNALPAGARVVFLWEARTLGCAAALRCEADGVIDRWWHARRTTGDPAAILAQWRAAGATHVLIYDVGAQFIEAEAQNGYAPEDWAALAQLRAALRPVATVGSAYSLYALP